MKKNILFLFLFLSFSIVAQEKTRFNKIDSLLTYLYENNKFMGAISLQENGNTVFEKHYGFADVENNIPADADTKYRIGSITKTFTASIIFQLIEEKKLTLETKLSKFYPEIPNAGSITIGMMLNHKSGIANYTDNTFQTYKTKPQTKRDMLKRIAALQPTFEPDTRAEYSNSNYLLLGYIIESITGKNYGDNVATRIVTKIGLKNTYYPKKGAPGKNEAFSYSYSDNKWIRTESWDLSVANAAGALVSTTSDLTTFINALFTGKIIKPTSLAQMTAIQQGYGKGLLQFPFSDKRFLGHNGIIEDFRSMVAYHSSDKTAISLIVNGNNYNENEILMGILSIYYKIPYRFPNLKTVAVDQKILKSYEGTYSTKQVPLQLTIKLENGELTGQATGQGAFPLKALSPTEFTFDAAGIEITFKNNGLLLKQGDSKLNFTKE